MASELKRELCRMPTPPFPRPSGERAGFWARSTIFCVKRRKTPRAKSFFGELRFQALLLQYLTRTIEASHKGLLGSRVTPLMQRILRYIDRSSERARFRFRVLAQAAHLSESRCKARFKREIGVPPAEFWLRKKIERAIECCSKAGALRMLPMRWASPPRNISPPFSSATRW